MNQGIFQPKNGWIRKVKCLSCGRIYHDHLYYDNEGLMSLDNWCCLCTSTGKKKILFEGYVKEVKS